MKKSELTKYIKEEIIDTLSEATPEEVEAQKELNKELEKTIELSKKAGLKEEFSKFKTYDDIIGGIIIRFGALENYVKENEPEAMDDLQKIILLFNDFDEKMAYGEYGETKKISEEEDSDDDAYKAAKAAKGKNKKYDLALKGFKEVETRMKSLARKYTEAKGEDKEKIKAELKKLTGQKAELKSLVDKYADDLV